MSKERNSTSSNTNNEKKKKNGKGRRRPRSEIGVGGARDAIRSWDHQQTVLSLSKALHNNVGNNNGTELPSFEEIVNNFMIDPSDPDGRRLLCNKDGGKWKIVISTSEMYEICVGEYNKRESWSSIDEYKAFMMEKYYINEQILDCLFKDPTDEDDKEEKTSSKITAAQGKKESAEECAEETKDVVKTS